MTPAIRRLMRLVYALTIAAGIMSVIVYPGNKIVFAFFCLVDFCNCRFGRSMAEPVCPFFSGHRVVRGILGEVRVSPSNRRFIPSRTVRLTVRMQAGTQYFLSSASAAQDISLED